MRQFIIAAAILSATSMSALARGGNDQGQNNNNQGGGHHAAPGPVVGAGLPVLATGVGYGVYWLRKRYRRRTTIV